MPELPEVETVVRGLRAPLTAKKIIKAQVFSVKIRTPIPVGFADDVTGATIVDVTRRAKYILIHLSNHHTIIIHLGMTGSVQLVTKAPASHVPAKHDHLFMRLSDGSGFVFSDPRRFGVLDLVKTEELTHWKSIRYLGPEPLEKVFTGRVLETLFADRKTAVKLALLNQNILVGVGNIYASEALFQAGISPLKPASAVRGEKAEKLCASIKKVLKAAIKAGGSSLRDYRHANGDVGFFQDSFAVYDREGEKCPGCTCDVAKTGGIKRIVQSGRSTFYCPSKQK
jgi:formamidopyrimidine-DNA glycosylase